MQEEPSSKDKLLFLFMGASNLARGYALLTRHLSKCLGVKNIEFLNALGPGRGFCAKGGMFNFIYPPIQDCQVIEAAEKKTKNKRVVLITDLGNDLMYGVTDEIFWTLNVPVTKKLGLIDGITSVLANLKRLVFCDILGWNKKSREFF